MPQPATPQLWFITGASSGLGLAYARAALEAGDRVVGAARRTDPIDALSAEFGPRVASVALDVTDADGTARVIDGVIQAHGPIDVLVNNAGAALYGAVEELTADGLRRLFELNLVGVHNVLSAALPHMRARRRGHIVNASSMSGFCGDAGMAAYNATKFALEGLSEALAQELAPLGLRVTIIEPGPFPTSFDRAAAVAERRIDDYAPTAGRMIQMMTHMDWASGDPARAGAALVALVRSDQPPTRLPFGRLAYDSIRRKLAAVDQELERWRDLALSTDAPGRAPAP